MYAAGFRGQLVYDSATKVGASLSSESSAAIGSGSYCSQDGRFYFAAKSPSNDPDDYDIYSGSVRHVNQTIALEDVRLVAAVNEPNHFDSQPALDPTGTRLYFVSDRPGGYGGTDIWMSTRENATSDRWSKPSVVPSPINTACDELSPSFGPILDFGAGSSAGSKTRFYFASNGHETVGGYDLFRAELQGDSLVRPENLGKPINTEFDELFPVAFDDSSFFWSSNVPASESRRNLYTIVRRRIPATAEERIRFAQQEERLKIEHPQPETHTDPIETAVKTETPRTVEKPLPTTPVSVYVHVRRGEDHRPATGADLYVRNDSVELYRGTVPASGNFLIKLKREGIYDIGAETEEAFFDVKKLELNGYRDSSAEINLNLPDTLVLRINFPFDDYQHPYEYVIDESGHATTITWQQTLDLTAHAALRSLGRLRELVLIGHTDSLGTDEYNARLGFNRATFIASELERRGVPKRIMKVLSSGRRQPVRRRPEESDELFRMRSRRVEFIKVFK
jgi:hypothetical protein